MGSMLVVDQDRANIKRRLQDLARPMECRHVQLILHQLAPTAREELRNAGKVLVPRCGYVFKLTQICTSQMLMQARGGDMRAPKALSVSK